MTEEKSSDSIWGNHGAGYCEIFCVSKGCTHQMSALSIRFREVVGKELRQFSPTYCDNARLIASNKTKCLNIQSVSCGGSVRSVSSPSRFGQGPIHKMSRMFNGDITGTMIVSAWV